MSGSSIPYHLRPHKAVDRRLFVDLLGRCQRWRSLANAAYISMGAYPLEDHKLVHRVLGLRKLIAFDYDEEIVRRQNFNRPLDGCKCLHISSGDLVSNFDDVLNKAGYEDCDGVIVWLDYTSPADLPVQIREFETLLDKLTAGDIVRITVNAKAGALFTPKTAPGVKPIPTPAVHQQRLRTLDERIGDYLPSSVVADDMTDSRLPSILSQAFGLASLNAFQPTNPLTFAPLSIVRYADGQQMLSLTGMVVPRTDETSLREKLELSDWRFASSDWTEVHELVVPDLTLRERLFLERSIGTMAVADIKRNMGFDFGTLNTGDSFLEDYQHYYRFYPNLLAAEA